MPNLDPIAYLNKSNTRRTLIFHLVLWVLAFAILIFVFTNGKIPVKIDYYYTIVFLVVAAIAVEFNFYVLIKYFLKKEKYILYLVSLILLGFGFGTLLKLFFISMIDILFPNYFFISYISGNDFYLVFNILLVATTLIKLAEDWIFYNKNQNQLLQFQKQHIQTQLNALRSQVNPHFLFNSLNVIYAMALENKAHIDTAIIELSDILRYVIYDSNSERISLKEEIKLIDNYIAFQSHRVNTEVAITTTIEDENFKLYPMLLLPLLENAYKYGTSSTTNTIPIEINLIQQNNRLDFSIKNQKLNKDLQLDDNYSGVGLSTLKKNLTLVYSKDHNFEIEQTDNYFKARLNIENNT